MHTVAILAEGNEENNFNSREVEELDLVAREVVADTTKEEPGEKLLRENMEETGGNTSNDGSEDTILNSQKERVVHSNEDAREIGDESGLDLFDERNKNMNGGDEVKENTLDDNVNVITLLGFRHASFVLDNNKVTSKIDRKTPSREMRIYGKR